MNTAKVKLGKYSHLVRFDKDEVIIKKACSIQDNIIDLTANIPKNRVLLTMNGDIITQFSFEFTAKGKWKPENKPMLEDAMAELNEAVEGADKILNNPFWRDFAFFMQDRYDVFYPQESKGLVEVSLIDQLREKPTDKNLLVKFGPQLVKDFDIKPVLDNKTLYYYYYNADSNSYEVLDKYVLNREIGKRYQIPLDHNDLDKALRSIQDVNYSQNYLWEFSDGYYLNMEDGYMIEQYDTPQLTPRKMGYEINEQFTKVPYNPNVEYSYPTENREITTVEKVIRQITIPKNDPMDERLYYAFLEIVGASFFPKNKHKRLIEFNGDGNDGKTTLFNIVRYILPNRYVCTPIDSLGKDNFASAMLANKNMIVFDEVAKNSLKKHGLALKQMSGGEMDNRGAYKTEYTHGLYGMIIILSNITPDLSAVDKATQERYDILFMPNKFVHNPTEPNEYPMNPEIFLKITRDKKGLEWLINASIKAYMDNNQELSCTQNAEETRNMYMCMSAIEPFLREYTEIDENAKECTPLDLEAQFQEYCDAHNIIYVELDNIEQLIGQKLYNLYGGQLKKERREKDRQKYTVYQNLWYNENCISRQT